MFAKVLSAAVLGIDAYIVEVEAHLEGQLPYSYPEKDSFGIPIQNDIIREISRDWFCKALDLPEFHLRQLCFRD